MPNVNESNENPNPNPASEDASTGERLTGRQPPKPRVPPKASPSSRESLEAVARVLRGEPEPKPDDPPQDDGDEGERPIDAKPPKSLEDLAKRLKVDPAALYDIEVPLREGSEKKSMKLGELKDYHGAQDDHRLSKLEWEEERSRQEADLARSRTELAEIMKMIPPEKLNQNVVNAVRERQDAIVATERKRTLERIPAWRDETLRATELKMIAEHLADYGFPASALASLYDHRMLAYLRDNALRLARINEALERVKPHRAASTPGRSKGGSGAPAQAAVRPSPNARPLDRQVSEISKLLRG